jgi:hypothetical protein
MGFFERLGSLNSPKCVESTSVKAASPAMKMAIRLEQIGRRTVHRGHPKGVSLVEQEVAELGLADFGRILQYSLEHRV